jgi:periplasmic protein TonB
MNFSNPAVAVMNDPSAKVKAFLFSLLIHLLLLATAIYIFSSTNVKTVAHEEHLMRVSLSEFVPLAPVAKNLPVHKTVQVTHHIKHIHKVKVLKKHRVKHIVKKLAKPVKMVKKTLQKRVLTPKIVAQSSEAFSSRVSKKPSVVKSDAKKVVSPQRISAQRFKQTSKPPHMSGAVSSSKLAKIRSLIESAVVYPAIAHKLGIKGVVIVSFILTKQGVVKTAKILSSSGSSSLDTEALQTILSLSGKYPKLETMASLKMPISFTLSQS